MRNGIKGFLKIIYLLTNFLLILDPEKSFFIVLFLFHYCIELRRT